MELDSLKSAGVTGEGVRLHSKPLEDGDKQVRGASFPGRAGSSSAAGIVLTSGKLRGLRFSGLSRSEIHILSPPHPTVLSITGKTLNRTGQVPKQVFAVYILFPFSRTPTKERLTMT